MKKFPKQLRNELLEIAGVTDSYINLSVIDKSMIDIINAIQYSDIEKLPKSIRKLIYQCDNDMNRVLSLLNANIDEKLLEYVSPINKPFNIVDYLEQAPYLTLQDFYSELIEYGLLNRFYDYSESDTPMSKQTLEAIDRYFSLCKDVEHFIDSGFRIIRKEFYDRFITTYEHKALFLKKYFQLRRDIEDTDFHWLMFHKLTKDKEFIKFVINNNCDDCYRNLVYEAFQRVRPQYDQDPKLLNILISNFRAEFLKHSKGHELSDDMRQKLVKVVSKYIGSKPNPILDCLRVFLPELIDSTKTFQNVLESIKYTQKYDSFPNILPELVDIIKYSNFMKLKMISTYTNNIYKMLMANQYVDMSKIFETVLPSALNKNINLYQDCNPSYITEDVLRVLAADNIEHIILLELVYPEMFSL